MIQLFPQDSFLLSSPVYHFLYRNIEDTTAKVVTYAIVTFTILGPCILCSALVLDLTRDGFCAAYRLWNWEVKESPKVEEQPKSQKPPGEASSTDVPSSGSKIEELATLEELIRQDYVNLLKHGNRLEIEDRLWTNIQEFERLDTENLHLPNTWEEYRRLKNSPENKSKPCLETPSSPVSDAKLLLLQIRCVKNSFFNRLQEAFIGTMPNKFTEGENTFDVVKMDQVGDGNCLYYSFLTGMKLNDSSLSPYFIGFLQKQGFDPTRFCDFDVNDLEAKKERVQLLRLCCSKWALDVLKREGHPKMVKLKLMYLSQAMEEYNDHLKDARRKEIMTLRNITLEGGFDASAVEDARKSLESLDPLPLINSLEEYCLKIRQMGFFGTSAEVWILKEIFEVPIRVFQTIPDSSSFVISCFFFKGKKYQRSQAPLTLYFDPNGPHYDYITLNPAVH